MLTLYVSSFFGKIACTSYSWNGPLSHGYFKFSFVGRYYGQGAAFLAQANCLIFITIDTIVYCVRSVYV